MRRKATAAPLLALLIAAGPLPAEEPVGQWTGYRSGETEPFEVEAPWILDWRIKSEMPQDMFIEISLMNSKSGLRDGIVLKSKHLGSGVKLFNQSGRFHFRVDSQFTGWNLKVTQLTPEEAELYTPIRKKEDS